MLPDPTSGYVLEGILRHGGVAIIGLKVQALSNDPRRERGDVADIELLTERYSREIDWERVREYFALFGRLELYDEIREAHGPADRS